MSPEDIQKLVWTAGGILAVLVAAGLVWVLLKALVFNGRSNLFRKRERRRLALVEWTSIGGGRELLLVRRDDVEHLILTGGPIDLVVETGIGKEELIVERRIESVPIHADFPRFDQGPSRGGEQNREPIRDSAPKHNFEARASEKPASGETASADNGHFHGAPPPNSHNDGSPLILTPEQAE
jgi:flagellar protein FliO/FliZ